LGPKSSITQGILELPEVYYGDIPR